MTDDLLSPRNALPMLDSDIRRLYLEATEPPPNPDREKQDRYETVAVKLVDLSFYVFASIALAVNAGEQGTWIFSFCAILSVFLLTSKLKVIGPVSLHRFLENKKFAPAPNPHFPLTNEVLSKVVDYVSRGPLDRHQNLSRKIEQSRSQITRSNVGLEKIISSLQTELVGDIDPKISILLSSRLDSAVACQKKLIVLSEEFRLQLEQAEAAIKPVVSLRDKFSFLSKVSSDLSAIQRAHGLIEEAQVQVIENRTQIQLLRTASSVAVSQLSEIESIVESKELARAEVAQLSL